jgi:hypothetical protein
VFAQCVSTYLKSGIEFISAYHALNPRKKETNVIISVGSSTNGSVVKQIIWWFREEVLASIGGVQMHDAFQRIPATKL